MGRRMRLYLFALLSFFSFNLVSAAPAAKSPETRTGASAFTRSAALPKWAAPLEPIAATKSEEPVVTRLAEVQYWTGANPAYLVNRAVQVNSSARISELGQFSISFIPAYQKLVLHRVAIMRGDAVVDRSKTVNVRVLDSENDAQKGYYYGASNAQLLLDDVKAGDTLWVTYSIEGKNPVFGSIWAEQLAWMRDTPMEMRKVTVFYPSAQPLQWRVSGVAQPSLAAPVVTEQGNGIRKMVFQEAALPALEYESSTPPDFIGFAILDFSGYQNWGQVAQWANALFSATTASAEVQALARKFSAGSVEERASQALHWVQDDIRYFSVSLGENSHRPQLPEVVLKRRFGDCKDKTQLLVALYQAMGIQSQPALLHALAPKLPAQFLPSPMNFNHAIVRVVLDGKPYFVDPTLEDQHGLISSLPVPVPSATALIVSRDSTGLVTLPAEAMDEALVDRSEQVTIAALHGDAQLHLRLSYRGRLASGMRQAHRAMSSADIRKMLLAQYERTYPGIRLEGTATLGDDNGGTSFVVEADLVIPHALKEKDGSFYLAQRSHILEGTLGVPDKLVRKQPLWLAAGPYRARYSLDVSLPGEARLTKADEVVSVQTKYFDAHSQLTWRGAHLNYYIDYAITNPEVAAADLPGLAEQARKLEPLIESDLRFNPVLAPPQTAKEASLRVLDIQQKMSGYEQVQDEAIRTGKMPELKLDESVYAKLNYRALCDSIVDSFSVRAWNPVLGMAVYPYYKIVEQRADKRTVDLCSARLDFIEHKLESMSRQLASIRPADDDSLTLLQAWADFHARKPDQARSNLTRFLTAKSASGGLGADDAALALALCQRLGMEMPEPIRQLMSGLRPQAWPMPLFDLLRGKLSAEELMASIEALPVAAREYATLEAHFYISQAYLAAKQPRRADEHLNWLARYGLLGSSFEVLADGDKYSAERADADMREAWRLKVERGSNNSIVRHLKAAAEKGIPVAQRDLGVRYVRADEVMSDAPKGMALLQAAADKGDVDAMNHLGVIYADGAYVKNDNALAMRYYRQAAQNGDPYAAYNLGRIYWFGEKGAAIDLEQSFRYMRDASEMMSADAQFFLARMYFEGKGTDKNDSLAMFWAAQGFYRNDVDSAALLGLLILSLQTDEAPRAVGMNLLLRAANKGNSFAQLEYGRILLKSAQSDSDRGQIFQLIQLAANDGNDRAQALLGRMYVEGIGVKVDVAKGMEYLQRHEKKNLPDAFYQLGMIYRNDAAGMVDKPKAAAYFRRGAELGQREAAESLAVMLHTGEGFARNLPEAVRYYELATKSGYPRAMNNLADIYLSGEGGVPRDVGKGKELLRRAAQMGNPTAMISLAELYETTPPAEKPVFLSLAYYLLASKYGMADADDGLKRMKSLAEPAVLEAAQSYVSGWKPGKAMPEES
jgi:TPR repeat protein/transglutaminase-like putative cysteine protease